MDVAIDDLEISQAPKIEQLRPGHIPVFPPHSKQRHPVIYLGVFPEPSACLAAAAPLKATQECCLAIRRIPNPRPCAAVERICWRSRKLGPVHTAGHPLIKLFEGLSAPRLYRPFRSVLSADFERERQNPHSCKMVIH